MKIKKFLQPFDGINIDDNYSNRNVVRNNDGSYSVNYNNSNYTMLPSALDSNNITVTTPEVVVTGKRPYSSWRWGTYVPFEYSRNSYYRPEDAMEAFNALTGGGLNNFSPTQWYRRIKDLSKLYNGLLSKEDYWNKWLNGNEGLVSQDFQKEHPYWSAGINLLGDAAALGGMMGIKKFTNISKPNVSVSADVGTATKQGITPLSLEEIEKAFNQARQWHLNRINSSGYKDRALRAGFTEEEIPQLLQLLTELINRLKLQNKEKLFPNKFSYKDSFGKINAEYWRVPTNKGLFLGIGFYNPNMSYDEAVSKFIHEFGHGATFGLNGNETTGLAEKFSKQFPLITRAVLYNKSLFPEVTEETVKKVFPSAEKNGLLSYYSKPTELLARGYEFMRDYGNNWWKLKNLGNSFTNYDVINNAANSRLNSKLFRGLTGSQGAYNFQKNALGISVPLGLGGYGLYNNDNLLQQLQYLKQGGTIHIKKKNRGKYFKLINKHVNV